jgi:hypothetical protein
MLAFIYLAYSMMALLKESVPAFEDTWIDDLPPYDLGLVKQPGTTNFKKVNRISGIGRCCCKALILEQAFLHRS